MKRVLILLIILLVLLTAAISYFPLGMPTPGALVSGPATTADGAVLVAENRMLTSRIYLLRDATMTGFYQEPRLEGGHEHRIVRVAADDAGIYALRLWNETQNEWELLRIVDGRATSLGAGRFTDALQITDLQSAKGAFWVTGIDESGAIRIYQYSAGSDMTLSHLIPADWLTGVVAAGFDGRQIRATDIEGNSYTIATDENSDYRMSYDLQAMEPMLPQMNGGWLICKKPLLLNALSVWGALAGFLLLAALYSRNCRRLSTKLLILGGCCTLFVILAAGLYILYRLLLVSGLMAMYAAIPQLAITAAAIWLATLLLFWMAARRVTLPLQRMTKQLERVSDGNITPREVGPGKDELHRMDRSIQEMCLSLSIRNYEMDNTLKTFSRFVPQQLTMLLDRPVAAEVGLGDNRRLLDHIGIFAVSNRSDARTTLSDDTFVDFLNHSVGVLCDCVRENNGILLSGDLRLSSMEAMFPGDANDGVLAGLDFLGHSQCEPESGLPSPELFLLLHKAKLLYGLSGREDRLFPYLSSAELEFLGSYSEKLSEAGVRIVVTDAYLKELEGFSNRYIGFVADKDREFSYKLYEILDAYPELQRNLRLKYDQRFQEGLRLFYSNDFYLARNRFSALVRACPEDGIARWYLFACERLFHQETQEAPDYGLFGAGL